jgi:putative hemolysin
VFFANADAVRVNPAFSDVLIPVEWVKEKRSPAKTRETLRLAGEAFAAEKCVVIFPSGTLARMIDGVLTEQTWHSTALALARKKKAPVIPLNLSARNSRLYYFLARTNAELRDITLFHELLNKKGARFALQFGPKIAPEALIGDVNALTATLRTYVSEVLEIENDADFVP